MTWIKKILRIYEGEGTKAFAFFLLAALLQAGIAVGTTVGDALFLARVGAAYLPLLFILMPVCMMLFIPLYSHWISRYGIDRIMALTLVGLSFAAVLIFFAIILSESGIFGKAGGVTYYCIKLYAYVWLVALYTLFWNFVDSYYDILDAKRLFPFFSGGFALGAAAGGGIVTLLSPHIPTGGLFMVWQVLALLGLPVLLYIRKKFKKMSVSEAGYEGTGLLSETREVLLAMRSSKYVIMLSALLFFTFFITTVCEFQYLTIFARGATDRELASVFGRLFLVVNLFNLVMNCLFFHRLVVWFGVRNLALFQPLVYLAAFSLFLMRDDVYAAIFGFFAYQGSMLSVDANNTNFLFNAVTPDLKKRVRTFVEGLVDPIGTSAAGLLLLAITPFLQPFHISWAGIGVCLLFLFVAVLLRAHYGTAMVDILRRGWLDFSQTTAEIAASLTGDDLRRLAQELPQGSDEFISFSLRLIHERDERQARDSVLHLVKSLPSQRLANLGDAFFKVLGDEDIYLLSCLRENQLMASPCPLEGSGAGGFNQNGDSSLLPHAGDTEERLAAMGVSERARPVYRLLPYLDSPDKMTRTESLRAVYRLVNKQSSDVIPIITGTIRRGSSDERIFGFMVLERIGDSAAILPVIQMANDLRPRECRAAERLIITIGLRSVPALVSIVIDQHASYASRSMAARTLGKIAFPQLETLYPRLIADEIAGAYAFLHYSRMLARCSFTHPGAFVLNEFYKDSSWGALRFVIELLAIAGRLPNYEMIAASLQSPNPKNRGNAIETLEQGVRRSVFRRLLPLLDSRGEEKQAEFYRQHFRVEKVTETEIAREAAKSTFDLKAAVGLRALWELDQKTGFEVMRQRMGTDAGKLFNEVASGILRASRGVSPGDVVDKLYHLRRAPVFARLGFDELYSLAAPAEWKTYKDATIYRTGEEADALYVVAKGSVEVSNEGVKNQGLIFGEKELFAGALRVAGASAPSAELLRIPANHLRNVMDAYPDVGMTLLAMLAGENGRRRRSSRRHRK